MCGLRMTEAGLCFKEGQRQHVKRLLLLRSSPWSKHRQDAVVHHELCLVPSGRKGRNVRMDCTSRDWTASLSLSGCETRISALRSLVLLQCAVSGSELPWPPPSSFATWHCGSACTRHYAAHAKASSVGAWCSAACQKAKQLRA